MNVALRKVFTNQVPKGNRAVALVSVKIQSFGVSNNSRPGTKYDLLEISENLKSKRKHL